MRALLAVALVAVFLGSAVALAAAPAATTGSTDAVGPNGATVHGTVAPNGQATTYHFDYGTTSAYGSSTPSASAGSGTTTVDVSAALSGLKPQTTYHYRLVATSSDGTSEGADATFTTSNPPPSVTTQAASSVTSSSAHLNGSVGPNGLATTYHFEYGTTTAYGSRTSDASAGSGTGSTDVSARVGGLQAGTRYHFRIVATNASGTTDGADLSFVTQAAAAPSVSTASAASVSTSGATLRGSVNPRGRPATYHFEYGPTTAYGSSTPETSAGQANAALSVSARIGGLAPGTRYHLRLVATGPGGTARSGDRSFVTTSVPLGFAVLAAPNPLRFGFRARLSGRLTGTGSAGRQVVLQANEFPFTAGWVQIGKPRATTAGGDFSFGGLGLRFTTQLRVQTADHAVTSRTVTVGVAVRVRTRVSRRHVRRHRIVRFSGTIAPAHDGVPFAIQKLRGRRWVTVAGGVTRHLGAQASAYSRRIRVARGGRYRVFVRLGGANVSAPGSIERITTY